MSADTPKAETPANAPKSRKKLVVIALAVVLAAGAGGAGAWWFTGRQPHGEAEAAPKPPAKTYFVNLEPFTVNLHDPRGERFAQVGVTLELDDAKAEAEIKDRLPAVRNNILLLLSSKEIEELLAPEGKQQLALEIRSQAGVALGFAPEPAAAAAAPGASAPAASAPPSPAAHGKPGRASPIRNVLFSQFIVQ